jgi:regulator of protease activity HflC (stomatin/prohibitin superfamily)
MALALVIIALVPLLVIGWVVSGIRVVHAHHRGVLERFGRYRKVIGPGPHVTLRLVHTIHVVDERETVQDVPVDVLTGDDIPVALDLAVLWECCDARRFVYDVGDFGVAVSRLLEHHVRGLVRQMTVDELLSGDSRLTDELTHSLDEVALTWGARITRIELCRIVLPQEVSEAMTELAAAQRHRIAVLVDEQAALEVEAVRAEGEHQARLRRAEVRQALLLMEAGRKAEAIRILADADRYREQSQARGQADAIRIVSNAVPPPALPRATGTPRESGVPSRS